MAAPAPAKLPVQPLTDPYGAARPEARTVIAAAQKLMVQGQWKTAWDSLVAFDPAGTDPYVLALKIQICLKGYVQTDSHLSFALIDVKAGESLAALRSEGGKGSLVDFDPFTAVQAMSAIDPQLPPVLLLTLGDYCYDVQAIYADKWQASEEEVCSVGISSYEEAQKGGLSTADSLRRQGELLLRFSRNDEAEASIRASLALEPGSLQARRSLAVALAQGGKVPEALTLMDEVIAATKDPEERFGILMAAARIGAQAGAAQAEPYLKASEAEFPGEPGPVLVRHMIAVQTQGPAEAAIAADKAMDSFPESPYVVRNILSTWLDANAVDQSLAFIDRNMARQTKDTSLAILGFYKALLVAQSRGPEGYPEARSILDAAEVHFKASYPAGDDVFQAIEQLRTQLAAQPAAAPADAAPVGPVPEAAATTP
jgi:tetratricopeptide (TPR) repeat protein